MMSFRRGKRDCQLSSAVIKVAGSPGLTTARSLPRMKSAEALL
jgi:hypothetical protein